MELITFESEAYKEITKTLLEIKCYFKGMPNQIPLSETWHDVSETCFKLNISKRTLQGYRDNSILSYSQIGAKIYFRASDIQELLESHYTKALTPKI